MIPSTLEALEIFGVSKSQPSQDTEADEDSQDAQNSQLESSQDAFRNRILSCLTISPAGRPLDRFRSMPELLLAFRDAIKAHRDLLMKGKILHRDVSQNNIIVTDPNQNDGSTGMLIDLDLATVVKEDGTNERSEAQKMTGTLKFVAIEVVELAFCNARLKLDYTYRHDLESFFYVLLSVCISCGWGGTRRREADPFQNWYALPYKDIATTKSSHTSKRYFESMIISELSPAFDSVKDLSRVLRDTLFGKGELNTRTDPDASSFYERIIKAYDEAIRTIE